MDRQKLKTLGEKLRTQVRGPVFEYVDGTLPLLAVAPKSPAAIGCPVCAKRRGAKAAAMKRYRAKVRK